METLLEIAAHRGCQIDSLKKRLKREGKPHLFGDNDKLPEEVIKFLLSSKRGRKSNDKAANKERYPAHKKKGAQIALKWLKNIPKIAWRKVLPVLPLPMLGAAASWGVFHFSDCFVPTPVAIVEAAGFELIYIGLSVSKNLPEKLYKLAVKISLGAVVVSVVYNTISAGLWVMTDGDMMKAKELIRNLHWVWFWLLALAHGAPLAVLGYFVADLNFKKSKTQ